MRESKAKAWRRQAQTVPTRKRANARELQVQMDCERLPGAISAVLGRASVEGDVGMGEPAFVARRASYGLRYFVGIGVGMGIAREGFEKGGKASWTSANLGQKPCQPAQSRKCRRKPLGTILDANVV